MGAVRTGGVGEVRVAADVDLGGTGTPTPKEPVYGTDHCGCARHQLAEPVRSAHVSGHHLDPVPDDGLGVRGVAGEYPDPLARSGQLGDHGPTQHTAASGDDDHADVPEWIWSATASCTEEVASSTGSR